jgi:arylsulfatase
MTNLRMDPYEKGFEEGGESMKFMAQQLWIIVPTQAKLKEFFSDFEDYPHQDGSSLNAGHIGYDTLKRAEAMERLKNLERLAA